MSQMGMSKTVVSLDGGPRRPGRRGRKALAALAAFMAACGLGGPARPAGADMVLTSDGKWFPPADPPLGPDDEPTPEMLEGTKDSKLDATYETVKMTGAKQGTWPAGKVQKLRASDEANEKFAQALRDVTSGFWKDAAEGFAAAAEDLTGFGKQEALYNRIEAYANAGLLKEMDGAIDDLLQAFPKSFFFCDAQIKRAKGALSHGDADGATKALEAVKAAPGMNARDAFRAEYMRVYLTLEVAGKADDAFSAYRKLVEAIDRSPDAAQGAVTKQKAMAGIGNSLLAKGKAKEATDTFASLTDARNADVLAVVYAGLGDIAFTEARSLREQKKLPEAKAQLEKAAEQYLRVSLRYKNDVEEMGPVLSALANQAKVFLALYEMAKDAESGNRALRAWRELYPLLTDDRQKRQALKDANDLDKRMKEDAANAKPPTPPKAPEPPPTPGMK